MISQELLEKYNMLSLEESKERHGDTVDTEKTFYETFLIQTDHIPLKIFENFIENMATASLGETFIVVLKFFKDVKVTYNEVLAARKFAREEINRIESEMAKEQLSL